MHVGLVNMKNEDIHYDEIQKFLDSNPTVTGSFDKLKFIAGKESTSRISKITIRPGGHISFDDTTSEYKDRSDYRNSYMFSVLSRMHRGEQRSFSRLNMVAIGNEEEHFQRSMVEENILPKRFNTLYNMLLNIAWVEMHKFRI